MYYLFFQFVLYVIVQKKVTHQESTTRNRPASIVTNLSQKLLGITSTATKKNRKCGKFQLYQ